MAASATVVWVGRGISALVSLIFVISAVMKLVGGAEVKQGIAHLGLPESMLTPLSILELACAVVYLIPATSVLGAILLTGYIGARSARTGESATRSSSRSRSASSSGSASTSGRSASRRCSQ